MYYDATSPNDSMISNIGHDNTAVSKPGILSYFDSGEVSRLVLIDSRGFRNAVLSSSAQDINVAADKREGTDLAHSDRAARSNVDSRADGYVAVRKK